MNWHENLHKLLEIVTKAGQAILYIYEEDDLGINIKDDDSPLTRADRLANRIICDTLEYMFPHIPIISEESQQIEYAKRKDFELFWLVDPLDGTKEFIHRNGEFTVNLALIKGNKVIAGIVHVPVTGEMYHAYSGYGAFKIHQGESKKLTANKFTLEDKGLRILSSRSHLDEETMKYISKFNEPEIFARGSSLKITTIAEGKAEVYPRLAPTMEWDTAAAQIILEEAGGTLIHNENCKPLQYNKENLLNPYFIAFGNLQVIKVSESY